MSAFSSFQPSKYALFIAAALSLVFIRPASAQDAAEDIEILQPAPEAEGNMTGSKGENFEYLTGEAEEDIPTIPTTEAESPSVEELSAPAMVPKEEDAMMRQAADIPVLVEEDNVDENLFFDANDLVPSGEMGRKGGPRKVNPAVEPASKLIVVKKNAGKNQREAGVVAAERAMKLGRYDAALEMYDRLYAINKRDPNVVMGRAVTLQNLGRPQEAIQAYEALLDLRPNNVDAEVNMLGLMARQYPAVALQRLMEIRNDNPNHVGAVSQIAVVQAELGRYNEALQYLGIAASMQPNNADHLFNIAVIADRAGNKKEAISYYEKALEVDTIYGGGRTIPREDVYERLARLR